MAKWIEFELINPPDNLSYKPKTQRWAVQKKAPDWTQLGIIKWYSGWRKYAFFPFDGSVYENDCLKDIANFIEIQMRARKQK